MHPMNHHNENPSIIHDIYEYLTYVKEAEVYWPFEVEYDNVTIWQIQKIALLCEGQYTNGIIRGCAEEILGKNKKVPINCEIAITQDIFKSVCNCLWDNGIEKDEAETVAQALFYIIADVETEQFMSE